MLEEQISPQELQDGEILRKIAADEQIMAALGRLVRKIHDDHFEVFVRGNDPKKSRKWLCGAIEACDSFLPAILGKVQDAETIMQEREEVMVEVSSPAVDGQGSGDLV